MQIYHDRLTRDPPTQACPETRNYLASAGLGARQSLVHENSLMPGGSVGRHFHEVEEVILCLEGLGEIDLGDGAPAAYAAGAVLIIPPKLAHSLRNVGDTTLRQLCFFPAASSQATWLEHDAFQGTEYRGNWSIE